MPIQNVIKERRKEIGLTQEQVANYLGVSTPAVNKWENGATYPDIALLAPLARLLNTDLNTLLCFEEELTDQEIRLFTKKIMETIHQDGFESGLELAQKKIEQYPNSAKLIHTTALLLDGAMIMQGMQYAEKEQYEEQIDALYERATRCDDTDIRNGATFMLASKHINRENFDKAQELLDSLPERNALDKRVLQANLLSKKGDTVEAEKIHERILLMSITDIWNHLLAMIEMELELGNTENASLLSTICSNSAALFQLSDYYQIVPKFQLAAAAEDAEESLPLIKALLESAKKTWNASDSVLFRHIPEKFGSESGSISILPALLNEIETSTKYGFLRDNKNFQSLLQQYRNG